MKRLIHYINSLNEWVGQHVAWLNIALVVLVGYDVLRRAVLNETSVWIMELQWHLFALVFLLGAGYALKHDKHVRVDLFYTHFSKREQAWVNFFGVLLLMIPWLLVMMYFSWNYAVESWKLGEGSPDPGGLPARYLIKFAIPVGLFLLFLQGIALLGESFLFLFPSPDRNTPKES